MLKLSSCFAFSCIIIYFVASLCAVIIKYGQQIMAWSLGNTSQNSLKVLALGQSRWLSWLSNLLQVTHMRNSPPVPAYEADHICILVLGWGRWSGEAGYVRDLSQKNSKVRPVRWLPGEKHLLQAYGLIQSWDHIHGERSYPDFSHMLCDSSTVSFKRWDN